MTNDRNMEEGLKFSEVKEEVLRMLQPPGRSYWVLVLLLFLFILFAGVWGY